MNRAVIFDLDGTLVDSQAAILASLRHVQQELGLPVGADDDLRWALGPPLADIMRTLVGSSDRRLIDEAVAAYRAHHATVCLSHAAIYPGIPNALENLHGLFRLFVGTTKLESVARMTLDHFGLTGYFEGVCGAKPDGRHAEKSELIVHVVATWHLNPGDVIMVGDRNLDIVGARACGVNTIAVTYGYGSREELMAERPITLCDSPTNLIHAIWSAFGSER